VVLRKKKKKKKKKKTAFYWSSMQHHLLQAKRGKKKRSERTFKHLNPSLQEKGKERGKRGEERVVGPNEDSAHRGAKRKRRKRKKEAMAGAVHAWRYRERKGVEISSDISRGGIEFRRE